ncbi:CDP-glucose 4,6-dehydratase [Methanosphaera sp. ISO3-F5]|uniref:CDP-glucose 4,6-dehydratase n=1 Tax=Methanosphaera sp. ISO3-F5 TaxID=1452353 RepID=UPI002B259B7C|nr:CDP-glucose 4,6-dehydratase [Methanosphaera sp. ISO3-F5]WQH65291.1 CDP-glucose 4,6-dehydratase [Methanosphaera sp. ISO3-F5]
MKGLNKFFKNKRVLITGHTGFKGSWLSEILCNMGSDVVGYSLNPPTTPNIYELVGLDSRLTSIIGDIRNYDMLSNIFDEYAPDIVIHMAAQPIVRTSYEKPVYTYETNVMGTVNVCECIRNNDCVRSFLNVTTDKVYENKDDNHSFKEFDKLDGFDPYSNSKSCSELVTHSYNNSFFKELGISCSTARAGNVIGGGDFAKDRIIPDCVRASINKEDIIIRNPYSIRPYQHVLEPLFVYLTIVMKQYKDDAFAGYYNVGPDERDCLTTGEIAGLYCDFFNKNSEDKICWVDNSDNGPHESAFLKLDNTKIKKVFNWKNVWDIHKAVEKTVEWTKCYISNKDMRECTDCQINEYLKDMG